jgi:monovalent cation:H+ antiporter-2, CPA2 family
MHPTSPLISIVVIGIGLAFVLGAIANRLKISVIVGYLLAGVAVGPFTPGYVAEPALAQQLAEIGVILLMFGVGLHFSVDDLLAVRSVAVPGALLQVIVAASLGAGLATLLGWSISSGIVFGLCLAVSSTVVLLRALQDRRLMETRRGHVAIGWLVIQDLVTVLALVLLPPLSALLAQDGRPLPSSAQIAATLAITLGQVVLFIALMLVVGRRAIPAILHYVAHTGSRELFRLAVLSVALVVAFVATEVFGVSFALGAFVAGMVLSESQLSQRAAEETLPLRDAFAVLFFVSVGMLFNPGVLLDQPFALLGTLAVIVVGTPLTAFLLLRLLGETTETAIPIAVGLAQIGEFSFILADLGIGLGMLREETRDLVLGASILSIFLNPVLFAALDRVKPAARTHLPGGAAELPAAQEEIAPTSLTGHIILVGYGRVGRLVAAGLRAAGEALFVVDTGDDTVRLLHSEGVEAIAGNAADPVILGIANVPSAEQLILAITDAFEAGQVAEQARRLNAGIRIIARAHFDAAVDHLERLGANIVVMGEREIARTMLDHARARPHDAGPRANDSEAAQP